MGIGMGTGSDGMRCDERVMGWDGMKLDGVDWDADADARGGGIGLDGREKYFRIELYFRIERNPVTGETDTGLRGTLGNCMLGCD